MAREVRALKALAAASGAEALPAAVFAWPSSEKPSDSAANGFVSPFYPGPPLTFRDPIPEAVLVTLAHVHAQCSNIEALEWTWSADAAHFEGTHANAMAALAASERFRTTTATPVLLQERLARIGRSTRLREASDFLPRSLTHGDMHPGNIVLRADGSPVIIDWGNACIALPMLDLANIVAIDSPEWRTYLAAYRRAGGTIDEATCRRAYWWARAITGLQYLPWIAEHTSDTPRMIAQIEEAEERLLA